MRASRRFIMLGALAALAALAVARPGMTSGPADSPRAKLLARIADLYASVWLMDVECEAGRENLLDDLKKLGKLDTEDQNSSDRKRLGERVITGKQYFRELVRRLHETKIELADAEAEYKASR